jgi:hypothetical protein
MNSCDDENKLGLPKLSEKLGIHMVGFLLVSTTLHIVPSKRPPFSMQESFNNSILKEIG